jgi:hypothetical protein
LFRIQMTARFGQCLRLALICLSLTLSLMQQKSLILYQNYSQTVGAIKNKLSVPILFLLVAASGIASFVSVWNSQLQGKNKTIISLTFLVIFLIGLLAIYCHFRRLVSILKAHNVAEEKKVEFIPSDQENQMTDKSPLRESSVDLLKGSFSKKDVRIIGEKILKNLAQEFEIVQGIFFILKAETGSFTMAASYACTFEKSPADFAEGEGISGQAAQDNKIITLHNLPESYSPVVSGLGKGKARFLYIIPMIYEKKSLAVVEISCFKEIEDNRISLLNQVMREGGQKLHSILSPEEK